MKKNEEDLSKSGFFTRILGFGTSTIAKQDEVNKKKINDIINICTKKLQLIKKGF